jgi:hypothetical protein
MIKMREFDFLSEENCFVKIQNGKIQIFKSNLNCDICILNFVLR